MQPLGTLGGNSGTANAINNHGQIVGVSLNGSGIAHATLWEDGAIYDLDEGNPHGSEASDINDLGEVAGSRNQDAGSSHAVVWTVPVRAAVDIVPGTIKLNGNGHVSATILSTPYFDAAAVLPASLTLGDESGSDAPVAVKNNGSPATSLQDVDGDGDMDLTAKFDRQALIATGDLAMGTDVLVLRGALQSGRRMRGRDRVSVVQ
jgi:probable HAF family extracellular repeat protein